MSGLVRRLTWRDWAVPAALWAVGQVELWVTGPQTVPVHGPRWPLAVALTLSAMALCLRRTHPAPALVVVVAALSVTTTGQVHAFQQRLNAGDELLGVDGRNGLHGESLARSVR